MSGSTATDKPDKDVGVQRAKYCASSSQIKSSILISQAVPWWCKSVRLVVQIGAVLFSPLHRDFHHHITPRANTRPPWRQTKQWRSSEVSPEESASAAAVLFASAPYVWPAPVSCTQLTAFRFICSATQSANLTKPGPSAYPGHDENQRPCTSVLAASRAPPPPRNRAPPRPPPATRTPAQRHAHPLPHLPPAAPAAPAARAMGHLTGSARSLTACTMSGNVMFRARRG